MGFGRCACCGVEGQGSRDFLCQDCISPAENRFACQKCGDVWVAEPEALQELRNTADLQIPEQQGGVTVGFSCCDDCAEPEDDASIKVFVLPARHLN